MSGWTDRDTALASLIVQGWTRDDVRLVLPDDSYDAVEGQAHIEISFTGGAVVGQSAGPPRQVQTSGDIYAEIYYPKGRGTGNATDLAEELCRITRTAALPAFTFQSAEPPVYLGDNGVHSKTDLYIPFVFWNTETT